jgi:archaellum biogenesis ATPase FlaH
VKKAREIDHSLFEKIIGLNVLTNEYYTSVVIDALKPEYIDNPGVRLVTNVVFDFYKKRGALPNISELKLYLGDDTERSLFKETVQSFKGLDQKYNLDELVFNTETFIKQRAIYKAVKQTVDDYSNGESDANATLQMFEKACSISLVDNIGLDFFNQIDKFTDDLNKTDKYISSGWKWLDEKLNGGFLTTGRALYVFSGQTNVGKSIFLGNVAANIAAQGKTVLVISLEMPETVYGKRISSKLTKIPFRELQERVGELKETLHAYKEQNPNARIIFKEFPPKSVTVNHIKAYIKKLAAKGIKPDAIVLDYLNLIAAVAGDNSYEKIKEIAEQVRALTYIFECPIITATQLNRSGYNTEPSLDTISESMGLGHTADVMIGIFQEEGDDQLGVLRISMMKNRFGDKFGICLMKIEYQTLSLSEGENHFGDDNETVKAENALKLLSDDK